MPYKDKADKALNAKKYYENNHDKFLAIGKARYESDKDYFKTKNLRHKAEIRDIVTAIKKQSSCEKCGFSDYRALQFHHRDAQDKEFNIGKVKASGTGETRLMEELAKCDILCANCHSIIHYENDND